MTGNTRDYVFRLRGDADQLAQAHERAAQAVDKHAEQTSELVRRQAEARQQQADLVRQHAEVVRQQTASKAAADNFVASLQRQITTVGKSRTELLALQAAELGVADSAAPLISQLKAATSAQEAETAAAARAAAAQQALANIRVAAQARERQAYQTQQNFVAGLQREAEAVGKTRTELLSLQAAKLGVSQQAAPLIARLQAGEKSMAGFARNGKLSAIELQQVGFQLNDLAVQVASGQNPITALVQQGSQLSGTFGGIRPAFSAVLSLLTPAKVLFGGVAATVGLLATAYISAQREEAKFRDGVVLSGNAAGVTRDSYAAMAATVREGAGITAAASRDIVQGLVATGRVGPTAIASVSAAAATLAKISGASAEEVVKDFAGMSAGVAQWALNANKAYNFLTPEIYRHIRALEAQGKTEEAMRVASDALNTSLKGRTRELGTLEKAWEATKNAASGAWDAMLNIGREQSVGERIVAMARALGDARAQLSRGDQRAGPLVAAMETQLETLRLLQRGEQNAAQQRAEDTKANNDALLREQEQYQSASTQLQRSGFALQQAQAEAARQAELDALQRNYERAEVGLTEYVATRTRLEQQAIDAKRAAVEQDIALERQRQPGSPAETLQQQARLNDLLARRVALQGEQLRLAEQVRRNFGAEARATSVGPADDLRRFKVQDNAAADAFLREQRAAGDALAADLVRNSRQLSIELIADDRARAAAQLQVEEAEIRKRLDLETRSAEDRARIEDQLADYIALRERQLTEQFKSETERQLELWEDYGRRRVQVNEEVNRTFVDGGRQAFGQMFVDGKVSFDNLAQYAARTLGEQLYERLGFGRTFQQLGDIVFSGIENVVGRVAGAGGGAVDNPSAQRDVLRQMEAAAADEIASSAATVLAKGREGIVTDTTTASVARLGLAADAAASKLAAMGGGGGAADALGSLFGSSGGGGFFNDAGGLEVLGSLGFAKGAAFERGVVQAFARGGVFGKGGGVLREPTVFPMARGMGVAAEAGEPEAVMPLRRTRNGRLGVEMAGGAGAQPVQMHVEVINNVSNARARTEQRPDGGLRVIVDEVEGALGQRIDNGTGLAGNIGTRFGLNGGAGLIR